MKYNTCLNINRWPPADGRDLFLKDIFKNELRKSVNVVLVGSHARDMTIATRDVAMTTRDVAMTTYIEQ